MLAGFDWLLLRLPEKRRTPPSYGPRNPIPIESQNGGPKRARPAPPLPRRGAKMAAHAGAPAGAQFLNLPPTWGGWRWMWGGGVPAQASTTATSQPYVSLFPLNLHPFSIPIIHLSTVSGEIYPDSTVMAELMYPPPPTHTGAIKRVWEEGGGRIPVIPKFPWAFREVPQHR